MIVMYNKNLYSPCYCLGCIFDGRFLKPRLNEPSFIIITQTAVGLQRYHRRYQGRTCEALMLWLKSHGYDELNAGGNSLIMADVMIAYKGEGFYGDILTVKVYSDEVTDRSFDLLYHIGAERGGEQKDIAHAKTGMICFDYNTRKIVVLKDELRRCL